MLSEMHVRGHATDKVRLRILRSRAWSAVLALVTTASAIFLLVTWLRDHPDVPNSAKNGQVQVTGAQPVPERAAPSATSSPEQPERTEVELPSGQKSTGQSTQGKTPDPEPLPFPSQDLFGLDARELLRQCVPALERDKFDPDASTIVKATKLVEDARKVHDAAFRALHSEIATQTNQAYLSGRFRQFLPLNYKKRSVSTSLNVGGQTFVVVLIEDDYPALFAIQDHSDDIIRDLGHELRNLLAPAGRNKK